MSYQIQVLPRAERQLAALEQNIYTAVKSKIESLGNDPRPPGCKKLKDRSGWRVRVGNYRVVYEIDDAVKIIAVMDVGHRREIYR